MKAIPGHSGYFVTESGEVYSHHPGRKLKQLTPQVNHKGYQRVQFKDRKCYAVHRLVAQTYIPNPDNLPQVNHIDENKLNNNLDNLEWCNNAYNMAYSKAKDWKVITPEGELIEVTNLAHWCKERGLHQTAFYQRGHTKGYKLAANS